MGFVSKLCGGGSDSGAEDELKFIKEQVNAYILKQGVDLASDDFSWYYGLCFILRKYTNKELSPSTIMEVFDKADTAIRSDLSNTSDSLCLILPLPLRRFTYERFISVTAREVCPNLSQHAKENLAICAWIMWGRLLGDMEQPSLESALGMFKRMDSVAIDGLKARFYANGWIPDWERAGH